MIKSSIIGISHSVNVFLSVGNSLSGDEIIIFFIETTSLVVIDESVSIIFS
jgi:hypothetical protein